MPCRDACSSQSSIPDPHSGEVAELLCTTLRSLSAQTVAGLPLAVRAWWEAHQERDRIKYNREVRLAKIREETKKALDKLSPRERKLLKESGEL